MLKKNKWNHNSKKSEIKRQVGGCNDSTFNENC